MSQPTPDADPATEPDVTTDAAAADQGDSTPEGADALGDPGKKALDAMKAARNEAKAEARQLKSEIEALKAQIADKEKTPDEQAIEAARREAITEATAKANKRIVRAEVRAQAAGKLADPTDALAYLNLDDFEVNEDGEIDQEAIAEAISDLLTRKPYLAADTGRQFPANDGNATRNGKAGPTQLTEQEVERMYAAKDYAGIEKARVEGRLNHMLGITS